MAKRISVKKSREVLGRHDLLPFALRQEDLEVAAVILALEQRIAALEVGLKEIKQFTDEERKGDINTHDCLGYVADIARRLTEGKSNG